MHRQKSSAALLVMILSVLVLTIGCQTKSDLTSDREPAHGELLWTFKADGSLSSVCVDEGRAYFSTAPGTLWGVSSDGSKLFERHPNTVEAMMNIHGAYLAPGCGGGLVYAERLQRGLDAMDGRTGKVVWHRGAATHMTPIYHEGTLLLPPVEDRWSGSSRLLLAWDAETGTPKWRMETAFPAQVQAVVLDDAVYLHYIKSTPWKPGITKLNLRAMRVDDGHFMWETTLDSQLEAALMMAPETLDTWRGMEQDGLPLRHIDPGTGETVWASKLSIDEGRLVAADGEMLITGNGNGDLFGIRTSSGETVWRNREGSYDVAGATIAGDIVYVTWKNRTLAAVDKTSGRFLWRKRLWANALKWPVIAGDLVLVVTDDHKLNAYAR